MALEYDECCGDMVLRFSKIFARTVFLIY